MKKIISMVLILTTLFSIFAVSASAARAEEYLSDVALVYEDSVEAVKAKIAGTEWKLFEQDLNPNADFLIDDGVYLVYKTSTNVEDAITDLRVMDMYGGYVTTNYQKELEETRSQYLEAVGELRAAASEFKTRYDADDEMAQIAYRQMNYYKDIGGTDLPMGEFFLHLPKDNEIVQVMMEGNTMIVFNLVSLLAVGISGAEEGTLESEIAEMYAIKDTLTDEEFYDATLKLEEMFATIKTKLLRYDALSEKYDIDDEEMTEEEYSFIAGYVTIAELLKKTAYGDTTLAEFLKGNWETKDLYPIVAAFTPGQRALAEMGQLETVLKYASPTKPIEELYATLDEMEAGMKDEDGSLPLYDVYTGVDREIFKGDFAMTNAAERQQAITGETWDWGSAATRSRGVAIAYIAASVVDAALIGTASGIAIKTAILKKSSDSVIMDSVLGLIDGEKRFVAFTTKWSGVGKLCTVGAIALTLIILGAYGISTVYNYYNPDYLEIPNTLIDVRESDLGDRYVKYTAAKVLGAEAEMQADFNAYQGKEWVALYYTKDANAGNCLLAKFVHSDSNATIARRHQGISMFGEDEAFNLNSHVYNKNAPGVYVTIRYSTAKKAAEDMPAVVGSMFATGALYALTTLAGAGVGVGATLLVVKAKRKKEETPSEVAEGTTEA